MTGRVATVYHQVVASWYGPGGTTACGEQLGAGTLGVANRTLPCGTRVTLRFGGRAVTVPVIDRGPFVAGRDYDLTYATKLALGAGDISTIWASA
jgi:rare lipoprotein A